jgi:hypothetical protein
MLLRFNLRIQLFFPLWIILCLGWGSQAPAWGQGGSLQISRVGLSRVKGTTFLTIITNQTVQPKIFATNEQNSPRLIIDFAGAQGINLPPTQAGDRDLVSQVRTLTTPHGQGVRIVLEMEPHRTYTYWRQNRSGAKGAAQIMIGLQPDHQPGVSPSPGLQIGESPPGTSAQGEKDYEVRDRGAVLAPSPAKTAPPAQENRFPEERLPAPTGAFGEIAQLMPTANNVLSFLANQGWAVQRQNSSDRPGQRVTQNFLATNPSYPELVIKITHIAGRSAVSPNINFITLSTENLNGAEADKYRDMRQWPFSKVKNKYEDIGDFYDDALKPLRIQLREQTKALTLRQFDFFRQFLMAACPQDPQLSEKILAHVRGKVNKRFEGEQYTMSENPLVIFNMVDFLYVRVYFLNNR